MQDTALGGSRGMLREVTLEDFTLSKFEVTQGEFEALMGFNPSFFSGKNLPVEQVNWCEAVEFCNAKSLAEGLPGADGYRFPTEAEWEYAARGGRLSKGYRYAGSDDHGEVAVCSAEGKTLPVGSKIPNEPRLHDMSGSWYNDGSWLDVMDRFSYPPDNRLSRRGFRVARSAP